MEELQEVLKKSQRKTQAQPQEMMSKEEYKKHLMKQNPLPTKSKIDFSKVHNTRGAQMLKNSNMKLPVITLRMIKTANP